MNDNEINRVIAEYMGVNIIMPVYLEEWCIDGTEKTPLNYTKSIDALIPVWIKLNACIRMEHISFEHTMAKVGVFDGECAFWGVEEYDKKLQQAAAHATAKVILELGKNEQNTI